MVDAHHHLWHYDSQQYEWITSEMGVLQRNFLPHHLEESIASANVAGTVVVQARQNISETSWLLDLAEASTTILGVVGWVPLTSPNLASVLDQFQGRRKLKGVRHVLQDDSETFVLSEAFNRGVAMLLGTELVYDILVHEHQLAQIAEFVTRHPEQVFVVDHLAKPNIRQGTLSPWRENLERVARNQNVYCKLSGLVTEADWIRWTPDDLRPYLDVALETFGTERLMAGSDWPVCLLASNYAQWWNLLLDWSKSLSNHEREQIMGATARRVYSL